MDPKEKLDELLNRWEDLADEGVEVTPEAHCQHDPELLEDFRKALARLQAIDRFLTGEQSDETSDLIAAGHYQPVALHAQGGIGDVFRAEDAELGRVVALKRIRRNDSHHPVRSRRFESEARITGHLEHPGIVPVYGFERDAKGRLFYAMRMIHGGTLQQAIERFHQKFPVGSLSSDGTLALQHLLRGFLKVCETMSYAHSRGIIHRDLKPSNIMVGDYGETLVVDWGLAKDTKRDDTQDDAKAAVSTVALRSTKVSDKTLLGEIKGSPAYMSPEQAAGDTPRIGASSDVYSLGATLFAILTNRKPYDGKNVYQVLEHVKAGKVPRPCSIRPDLPKPLEAICLKAMSLKPADRYATPNDLASDVEHWLADEPVSAWREPLTKRTARWAKRHRTLVVSLVAVTAVMLGALGITSAILRTKNRELTKANNRANENFEQAHAALLNVVDLALHGRTLGDNPYLDPVRVDVLQRALQFSEGLRLRDPENRDLIFEQAMLLTARGEVETRLGEMNTALKSLQQAVDLFGPPASDESVDFQHGRAVARFLLAEAIRWRDLDRPEKSDTLLAAAGGDISKLVRSDLSSARVLSFSRTYNPALLLAKCVQSLSASAPERTAWLNLAEQSLNKPPTTDMWFEIQRNATRARLWSMEMRVARKKDRNLPRIFEASEKSLAAYKRCIELTRQNKTGGNAAGIYEWEMAEVEAIRGTVLAESGKPTEAIPKLKSACETQFRLLGDIEREGAKLIALWNVSDPSTSRGIDLTTVANYRLQLLENQLNLADVIWDAQNEGPALAEFQKAEKLLARTPAAGLTPWSRIYRAKSQARVALFLRQQPSRSREEVRRLAEEAAATMVELQDSAKDDPELPFWICNAQMLLGEMAIEASQPKVAIAWLAKIIPYREKLTAPEAPLMHRFVASKCAALLAKLWLDTEGATLEAIWKEARKSLTLLDEVRRQKPELAGGDLLRLATDTFAAVSLLRASELTKKTPVARKELHDICEPARAALRRLPEFAGPLNNIESQLLKLLDKALQDHPL